VHMLGSIQHLQRHFVSSSERLAEGRELIRGR
jgi:hypothetical protein